MSKITIEFKIPQDQEEFNDAINGEAWHMVVQDFDELLRRIIKDEKKPYDGLDYKVIVGSLREELYNMVQSFRLHLD